MTYFITIPGILLIFGSLLLTVTPKKVRPALFLLFPVLSLLFVTSRPEGYTVTAQLLNYDLVLMQVDDLSRIFGIIFSITAFVAGIYAYHMKEMGQQVNGLLYAGSEIGERCAGELLTCIVKREQQDCHY